ncbi:cytochrome B [Lewinella sp. W8]|uniref:cytochrome B n=1 Tax=Lewinella sp. W8 TaxID=2528208 RepID=UPI0010671C3A|nr:cytochrome B [Lewinella sp. W8]MTB53616.1 cytochrome B [Lewinella sp. W8]
MYTALQHAHSGLRWVVLVLLVAAILKATNKRRGGSVYPGKDKLALFAMISVHVQLLLGLILYLWLSPYVQWQGDIMGQEIVRFYTVEHILGMLIGIAFITIGYSKAKRQVELNVGWKTIGRWYFFGLLLILLSIPWPFRVGFDAGWF